MTYYSNSNISYFLASDKYYLFKHWLPVMPTFSYPSIAIHIYSVFENLLPFPPFTQLIQNPDGTQE